jgi:hypothetical protein
MPEVKSPAALKEAFDACKRQIRDLPTQLVLPDQTLFRQLASRYFEPPSPGGHVSKIKADKLLIPREGMTDGKALPDDTAEDLFKNRFSGVSLNPGIPSSCALYCSMQQQALMNEAKHYLNPIGSKALNGRCVLKFRVIGSILVADLSPHNPGAVKFVDSLGKDYWKRMNDKLDCSVSRGIGLAIAQIGYRGLIAQTVRPSNRSAEERGDNLLLFARPGQPVSNLSLEDVTYFEAGHPPRTFPAMFP